MALPSKKSRPITVNNIEFHYIISTTKIDDNWRFSLNLTVQNANGQGSKLKTEGLLTRDIWLDFSDAEKLKKEDYPVLKPKDIQEIIKTGLNQGWDPKQNGKTFRLKIDNSLAKHFARC